MSTALPRTIRVVGTRRLMLLEQEAERLGLSQRLATAWLLQHVDATAVHYLFPMLVHELGQRAELVHVRGLFMAVRMLPAQFSGVVQGC
ncbi:hypothetical protein [Actinacidiphila glaucinigra]|uniref:hypothetical protein n=1 Tax=Actinacidiphila glaucinigra TaxID=235986 RepID=UPI002E32DEC8|nr:hypothetical protein [Actinacidiphila glaucinigra]